MANQYGTFVAKRAVQQRLNVGTAEWIPLSVGSEPMLGRDHIRVQVKSPAGLALALEYANAVITTNPTTRQQQKSFTAPTTGASGTTVIPGNNTFVEPLGENVAVYGRLVQKKGETDNSITVIVTEYA